jgi:hypothetical protein
MTKTVANIKAGFVGIALLAAPSSHAQERTGGEDVTMIRRPLFPTPETALALVRKLGPSWQGYTRLEDQKSDDVVIRRYYFSSGKRFVNLRLAPDGRVFDFYLYVGQPERDTVSDRCSLLPTPLETARILLAVVEPNHTLADEKIVAGSAMLGWQPLHSIQNARVLRTRIRFTSFSKACQIFMRRDW